MQTGKEHSLTSLNTIFADKVPQPLVGEQRSEVQKITDGVIARQKEIFDDPDLSLAQKADLLWEEAAISPDNLSIVLTILAIQPEDTLRVTHGLRSQEKQVLQKYINERIPPFLRSLKAEQAFTYCMNVAPTLGLFLGIDNVVLPKETPKLLVSMVSRWDEERQLYLFDVIEKVPIVRVVDSNGASKTGRVRSMINQNGHSNPSDVLPQFPIVNRRLERYEDYKEKKMHEIQQQLDRGPFNAKALRLALAALTPDRNTAVRIILDTASPTANAAINHIRAFRREFTSSPSGHLDALKIICKALQHTSYANTRGLLLRFLTDSIAFGDTDDSGWIFPSEELSFSIFSKQLLATLEDKENPHYSEAKYIMDNLLDVTMIKDNDTKRNEFISDINYFNQFTKAEKIALTRHYLSIFEKEGVRFDPPLPEDALLNIFSGTWTISCSNFNIEDTPIIIAETSDVVGHVKRKKPQLEPEESISTAESQLSAAEEVIFKVATPQAEEEIIASVLEKAGIENSLPDYVIEAIDSEIREVGKDIPKENMVRTRTLSPKGNFVKFEENLVKAGGDDSLSVYFKHSEPQRINGTFSSDIFGTLSLTPDLKLDFFIDKDGYPQGDIDKLYDQGLVSWDQIWQIKYRIAVLCHKLLIVSQEELASRRADLADRANKEIGVGQWKKLESMKRLETKILESKQFIDEAYWEWSMQPKDDEDDKKSETNKGYIKDELDEIDEIICRKKIEDMERKGETIGEVWRQLDLTAMERAKKEARGKGHGVKKKPKTGRPMFFRDRRRPTVQAIDNAIYHGVGLYKIIEISKAPFGDIYDKIVTRSTFVSSREKNDTLENIA